MPLVHAFIRLMLLVRMEVLNLGRFFLTIFSRGRNERSAPFICQHISTPYLVRRDLLFYKTPTTGHKYPNKRRKSKFPFLSSQRSQAQC